MSLHHQHGPAKTHSDHAHHDHAHENKHEHKHAPDHSHVHHVAASMSRAFAIGVVLNLGFVIAEAAFGFWAQSLSLLADASHNFGDVIGLLLAWGAAALMSRRPSTRFTYGLGGSTILAALANAMLLMIAVGGIAWAAVERLSSASHPEINQNVVIWVAAVGIVINGLTAMMFHAGQKNDLNARAAFLHMAADAAISLGVVIAALVTGMTHWDWLDPVVSLVIAAVIFIGTWGLLKASINLALQAVPEAVNVETVRTYLASLPGVTDIHDLHIWAMSTTDNALTAHLLMPGGHPGDIFLAQTAQEIEQRFRVGHATFQIETGLATSTHESNFMPCKQAQGHRA